MAWLDRVIDLWKFLRLSQRRKRELVRISRLLDTPTSSVEQLLSNSRDSVLEELLLEELFDLILGQPMLLALLQKHGATREDLRELYWALLGAGAGQWVRGHWVAASALCYGFTLEFVLTRSKEGKAAGHTPRQIWQAASFTLIEYFEKGRVGKVGS